MSGAGETPCRSCGGTGDYWDRAKGDWGRDYCTDCDGLGLMPLVREYAETQYQRFQNAIEEVRRGIMTSDELKDKL